MAESKRSWIHISPGSFLSSVVSMFSQDVVVSGLAFVGNIILARWLGPVQLGIFYVINLIPSYSEKFGRLGTIDHAAIYYMGKKKYGSGEIAGHLTWISALLSFLPIVAFAFFQNQFRTHFLKSAVIPDYYIWTVVAAIPFIFLFVAYNKILIGLNQVREYGTLQVFKSVLLIGVCLFFWWRKWDLYGLCLATFIAALIPALMNLIVMKSGRLKFGPNPELIRDLFGYGWKAYLVTIVLFLHLRADLILVSYFLQPADVSFYAIAVSGAQLLWKIPNAVSLVLYAKVSSEEKARASLLTSEAMRVALFLMIFTSLVGLALITPFVSIFYGKSFLPVVKPFMCLLPGVLSMGLAKLLTDYFYGLGKPQLALNANFICTPINIILNILLIKSFGVSAAALISSLTYTIYFLILAGIFLRDGGLSLVDLLIVRKTDLDRFRGILFSKA